MKIRAFKTFSQDLDYINISFLPVINLDWFIEGKKCLFIGWLIWGLQIKWDNLFD